MQSITQASARIMLTDASPRAPGMPRRLESRLVLSLSRGSGHSQAPVALEIPRALRANALVQAALARNLP